MRLIQPVRSGLALAAEIAGTAPARGSMAIWWLGQSGFVVKTGAGVLVIDPYLSDSLTVKYEGTSRPHVRMMALALEPRLLSPVDLILCSHKHSDHMDAASLSPMLEANPRAVVGLPEALAEHAARIGVEPGRQLPMRAGTQIEAGGFRARAIPSAHETLETDEAGRHLCLGFVVETEGMRLYHSGDGLVYDGLVAHLGDAPFDVMMLPINGRDPARGVPGNMSAGEAVDLAARVRPRYAVPHHYDMFTFNTVPVSDFEVEARRLPAGVSPRVLRCGERWEVSAWESP